MTPEYDILRFFETPEHGHLRTRFRHVKINRGAILEPHDREEPDIAVLLSGHIRAYFRCGEQQITVFNAERGAPIWVTSRLVLSARQTSEILLAPRATFLQIMTSTPELCGPLCMSFERIVTQSLRVIEGMRFLNVKERLIRYIIDLGVQKGRPMEDGLSIPFEQTIESVANDIGASRQTTSQTLNSLIKAGYIRRVSRTQLIAPDIAALKKTLQENDLARKTLTDIALVSTTNAYSICPNPLYPVKTDNDTPPRQVNKHRA